MNMSFKIKLIIAKIFDIFGMNLLLSKFINLKYKNNYIRLVNYHFSPVAEKENFEKQVQWFLKEYENCDYKKFCDFLDGKYKFSKKPGIMFTFDDGFLENYEVAYPMLKKYNATGYYMVSSGLIGATNHVNEVGVVHDYMGEEALKEMLRDGHVIGCHTFSHHRMNINDSEEVLKHEIIESKQKLENILGEEIQIFCWCGGEEHTYTKAAADVIRNAGYKYGFMTNSSPLTVNTNRFQIDRVNVEASWPMSLVRFQVSGFIDYKLRKKRNRVQTLTGSII